jgi:hypothetical protein
METALDKIINLMHKYFISIDFEINGDVYMTFNNNQKIIICLTKYNNYIQVDYTYFDDKGELYNDNMYNKFIINGWHSLPVSKEYRLTDFIDTFKNDVILLTKYK